MKQRLLYSWTAVLGLAAFAESMSMSSGSHYMLSANEMQFVLTDSINRIMENPEVGSATVLDFSVFPPRRTDIPNVPCSVSGPPLGIAVTPDNQIALVTSSTKIDPADSSAQVSDNRVTVIDLDTKQIIQTLSVGKKASGMSIAPDGKTALVCNRDDGSLTALRIHGKDVTVSKTLKVAEPEDSLSHTVFSPDGTYVLATLNLDNSVIKIQLENGEPVRVIGKVTVGTGPYAAEIAPDGQTAVVANVNGATISILDLTGEKMTVADTIYTGVLPEGMDISPDGKWVAVSSMGYTMKAPDDSMRQQHGQLVLLKKNPKYYSIVQRLQIDRIPQAVSFTADSNYVVVGSFESRRLRIYELSGEELRDTGIIIPVPGQPCSLRIAE
jgi:WD40 repeat protein